MRKTYPTSSRSAAAVEDGEYGDLLEQPRPRAPRRKAESASRFDDFDPRDLALDDWDEASASPSSGRNSSRSRSRKSTQLTTTQWLLKTTGGRVVAGIAALMVLAALGAGIWMVREFLRTDPRFRVASAEQIEVSGNHQVSADDVRSVFGSDVGHNLFFIPIALRRQEMEGLPWVETASVERLLPNRIHVRVTERTPVAFAQNGSALQLIDRHGVLLDMPSGPDAPQYSFPVLTGVGEEVPLSTRKARMDAYMAFLKDLDGHGEKVSPRLSEVDLSEPEDVQVLLAEGATTMTLHFGEANFFEKYQIYQAHLSEWQQKYPRLAKVDLRNAPQVVLGMADASTPAPPVPIAVKPEASAVTASENSAEPAASSTPPVEIATAPAPVHAVKAAAPTRPKAIVKAVAGKKPNIAANKKAAAIAKHSPPAKPAPAPQPVAARIAAPVATDTPALHAFNNAVEKPSTPKPRLVMHPQALQPSATVAPTGGQQ